MTMTHSQDWTPVWRGQTLIIDGTPAHELVRQMRSIGLIRPRQPEQRTPEEEAAYREKRRQASSNNLETEASIAIPSPSGRGLG